MKRFVSIAVLAGAAVGVLGSAGGALAAPQYVAEPGISGGRVKPVVGTYEQTGEYDYSRTFLTGNVSAKGATLNKESYTTSYTSTYEQNQTVTANTTGVTYTETYDEWGPYGEGHTADTTGLKVKNNIVSVKKEASVPDCTTGTYVQIRPLDPADSTYVNDEDC